MVGGLIFPMAFSGSQFRVPLAGFCVPVFVEDEIMTRTERLVGISLESRNQQNGQGNS